MTAHQSPAVPPGPVFLTGGTGLVGSHVAERLRAEGIPVRALHRPTSRTGHLERLGCDLVTGDLLDSPEDLEQAMRGCGALVHCAAVVYSDQPWSRVRALNVGGTEAVVEAAVQAGIRRLVHLSSVAVYGGTLEAVDEASPLTSGPTHSKGAYARSKKESEAAVAAAASDSGMVVVILRPSVVYGERDRLFSPVVARALSWPIQPVLGRGDTPIPAVYAGNLAHAVVLSLGAELVQGLHVFNVGGDHRLSQRRLYTGLAAPLGRRVRILPIPELLVRLGAGLADALRLGVPGAGELSFRRAAALALRPNPYSTARLAEKLGWDPPVPLAEALERTGRWLASEPNTLS